jgi:hypothetical protein
MTTIGIVQSCSVMLALVATLILPWGKNAFTVSCKELK